MTLFRTPISETADERDGELLFGDDLTVTYVFEIGDYYSTVSTEINVTVNIVVPTV